MKKSKKSKSKSKTTKATPKKAKSTKKPRTTRTQTKSYNNPKYKNQDGGFVRGVLFLKASTEAILLCRLKSKWIKTFIIFYFLC